MPLDKPCFIAGCTKEGVYGRGSLLKGTIVWACPEHEPRREHKSEPPAPKPARVPRDLFSVEPR